MDGKLINLKRFMKKHTKLQKLIEIAVANGWRAPTNTGKYIEGLAKTLIHQGHENLIFSHDFAKAIWGEEDLDIWVGGHADNLPKQNQPGIICTDPGSAYWIGKKWQYHLQQAVISDDPLEYYWQNKPKDK